MSESADSTRPVPDERFREIAAILGAGVLRLRARVALFAENIDENTIKSCPTCLEVPDETVLSGDNGVYGFREPE